MKKVLIIAGSPRKDGNSDLLALQFAKGAADKKGEVKDLPAYNEAYELGKSIR